jgi:hypothetical protein
MRILALTMHDHRGYVVSWEVSEELARKLGGMAAAGGGEPTATVIGLTTSQGIGLALLALGFVLYAIRRNAGRDAVGPPASADGDLLEELT